MISAFIRFGDGSISTDAGIETLKRARGDQHAQFWVDFSEPSDAELQMLSDVFSFHPLAIEDVVKGGQDAKIEPYGTTAGSDRADYYFMVVHGPDLEVHDKLCTKELDFFLAECCLVTVHRRKIKAVIETLEKARKDPTRTLEAGIDMLMYTILDALVDDYFPILDKMQAHIDKVEDQATSDPHSRVLRKIGGMKRDLLHLRRTIGPQREVLAKLTRGEVHFVGEHARVYLRDVQDHLNRVVETIEIFRDLILGARDIYLSSISNHLNQIMKTLTIITVVALPFTIVTGFFGMNFEAVPGLHSKLGFWLATGGMFAAMMGLLYLFKVKRWI
ncbi:MAG: magnesium/cobalt transporter CorA [Tepidisphaeraceae bacterium]